MRAVQLVNITDTPKVYIKNSVKEGKGLFAKKHIPAHTPIVIYYGDKIMNEDIYKTYVDNKDNYVDINKYIRGTSNGFAIKGDINKAKSNLNLAGVYVNDAGCINCNKEDVNLYILQDYANTLKECNLEVINTCDYPVYMSTKRIRKNEELLVHYGIGYWLLNIGYLPSEISEMNELYDFSSFY